MTAILAAMGSEVADEPELDVRSLLASMSHRGHEEVGVWRSPEAALAVARDRWETAPAFAGATLVGCCGHLRTVCDATLYYEGDLEGRLRTAGVIPESDSAADLIAAAYAAFGARCVDYLEGDFAFAVWDSESGIVFCARDPFGVRSLYYTQCRATLLVSSTPDPLIQWQGTRASFDPEGVLRSIIMQYGDGSSSAWEDVHSLPAGCALSARPSGIQVSRYWFARGSDRWQALSSEQAPQAFADLLAGASSERLGGGETALAMSGGRDSTAILASLQPTSAGSGSDLIDILSFRFRDDDPGNERDYIEKVVQSFDLPVHWVEIEGVDFFRDAQLRARTRSDPFGHLFEEFNRTLARIATGMGDRILFAGHGGDDVCGVGDWTMADLFRAGKWLELRKFLSSRGYRGLQPVLTHCVRPSLPPWVFDVLERLLNRPICSRPFEEPIPSWVAADDGMLRRIRRADRQAYSREVVRYHSTITGQRRAGWLMNGFNRQICTSLFDFTREEGAELRLPFYDRRVVEFAMSRPAGEFNQPGEYKALLKRAMRGKLPERALPRFVGGKKAGSAVGTVRTRLGRDTLALLERMDGPPWISEELGIVDWNTLVRALESGEGLQWWSMSHGYEALLVEGWLRVRRPA